MKKINLLLILIVFFENTPLPGQQFVIQDTIVSDTTSSLEDPEFDWLGHHICWANEEGIWVASVDFITGNFIPSNGKGVMIDPTPSYYGMTRVANGPEWAFSQNSSVLIYPDSINANTIAVGTSKKVNNVWVTQILPNSNYRIPYFGSIDINYTLDGITCASYNPSNWQSTGMKLRNSSNQTEISLPQSLNSYQGGRWINGLYGISLGKENNPPYEVGYFDVNTNTFNSVAILPNPIDQTWMLYSAELGSFVLWCVEKKQERDEIAFFRQIGTNWVKYDSVSLPTNRLGIYSPEHFTWNDKDYIFMLAQKRQNQPGTGLYEQVWLISISKQNRLIRMVSDTTNIKRSDPEVFFTVSEPVIYYTENRAGKKIIHKCNTGLGSIMNVNPVSNNIPDKFELFQNFPNPFNPVTKIKFDIPESGFIELKIFDITGREVRTLVNTNLQPGSYEVLFDGSGLPSGVYFYLFKAGGYFKSKKMLMIK
jgi:hypothetical protein